MEIRNITGARELNVLLNESYRNNTRIRLTDQDHVAIYTAPSNPVARLVSWFRQALGITQREQAAVARRLQDLVDQSPAPAEPAAITRRVRAVSTPANPGAEPAATNHSEAQEPIYATVNKGRVVLESDEAPPLPPRNYLTEAPQAAAAPAGTQPAVDAETAAAIGRDESRVVKNFMRNIVAHQKLRDGTADLDQPLRTVRLASTIVDFIHSSKEPMTEELRADITKVLGRISIFQAQLDKGIAANKVAVSAEEKSEVNALKKKVQNQEFLNITARSSNPVHRDNEARAGNLTAVKQMIEPAEALLKQLENFTDSECTTGLAWFAGQLIDQRREELQATCDHLQATQPESQAAQTLNKFLNTLVSVNVKELS
jgi:hypothetical protein